MAGFDCGAGVVADRVKDFGLFGPDERFASGAGPADGVAGPACAVSGGVEYVEACCGDGGRHDAHVSGLLAPRSGGVRRAVYAVSVAAFGCPLWLVSAHTPSRRIFGGSLTGRGVCGARAGQGTWEMPAELGSRRAFPRETLLPS